MKIYKNNLSLTCELVFKQTTVHLNVNQHLIVDKNTSAVVNNATNTLGFFVDNTHP